MKSRLSVINGRQILLGATALSAFILIPATASAQDEAAPAASQTSSTTDMAVVTGSRIARRNDSSDSPLYTVSNEALLYTSETSLDQQLKKLPQFGASANHIALVTNDTASQEPLGSYDIFDLSAQWSVSDVLELRAGIDNLFDRAPHRYGVIEGVTTAADETDPGGAYDVIGRRFYIGARANF